MFGEVQGHRSCLILFVVRRMSQTSPVKRFHRIDVATKGMDRPAVLRMLGLDSSSPIIIGDFTDLHTLCFIGSFTAVENS